MFMRTRRWMVAAALVMVAFSGASARKREKVYLPAFVLKAQTVLVVILPGSGEPVDDITANRKAQEEVEKAFMKWGRYRLAVDADQADLVVGVRKGTGKVANPTINGGPVDSRPGTIETTDNQIRIGVQQGHPPDVSDPAGSNPANDRVHNGMETGAADDTFQVFQGGMQYPLDNPAVWKFTAKDGLKPPAVAAVEQFRKAVEESEKSAQQKQQAQQPGQKKNP
ncbi:MAG TPA: hypothetical protein VGR58_08555 [Candidatus Acidoferrum sp.]|nr:hypothetical protein [Candidatus Acidoferrum sp.]